MTLEATGLGSAGLLVVLVLTMNSSLAGAQVEPRPKGDTDCVAAADPDKAPTPVETGESAGSKNMGATGWSGAGLGGSHNSTTYARPISPSKTLQPELARGLDPTKSRPKKGRLSAQDCVRRP